MPEKGFSLTLRAFERETNVRQKLWLVPEQPPKMLTKADPTPPDTEQIPRWIWPVDGGEMKVESAHRMPLQDYLADLVVRSVGP
jgi:hypothetical protein